MTYASTEKVSQNTEDHCNYKKGVPVCRGLLQLQTRCPSMQRTTGTTDTVTQYSDDYFNYRHGVPEYRGLLQLDTVSQSTEVYCK